jgi:hypothetical protein
MSRSDLEKRRHEKINADATSDLHADSSMNHRTSVEYHERPSSRFNYKEILKQTEEKASWTDRTFASHNADDQEKNMSDEKKNDYQIYFAVDFSFLPLSQRGSNSISNDAIRTHCPAVS